MTEDNNCNLQYFEGSSMSRLYDELNNWQNLNKKRFLSLSIQKDEDKFCCIALTNPTEVVITSRDGRYHAEVNGKGELSVDNYR